MSQLKVKRWTYQTDPSLITAEKNLIHEVYILDPSIVKRKQHSSPKEKTKTMTYRLPVKMVEELETQANQQNTSQNVLIKQIVQKYLQWDRFSEGIAISPIPKNILQTMGNDMTAADIDLIVESVKPIIKDSVMFMKRQIRSEKMHRDA